MKKLIVCFAIVLTFCSGCSTQYESIKELSDESAELSFKLGVLCGATALLDLYKQKRFERIESGSTTELVRFKPLEVNAKNLLLVAKEIRESLNEKD